MEKIGIWYGFKKANNVQMKAKNMVWKNHHHHKRVSKGENKYL